MRNRTMPSFQVYWFRPLNGGSDGACCVGEIASLKVPVGDWRFEAGIAFPARSRQPLEKTRQKGKKQAGTFGMCHFCAVERLRSTIHPHFQWALTVFVRKSKILDQTLWIILHPDVAKSYAKLATLHQNVRAPSLLASSAGFIFFPPSRRRSTADSSAPRWFPPRVCIL